MRDRSRGRRARVARTQVLAGVAALLTTAAVTAGYASQSHAVRPAPVPARSSTAPPAGPVAGAAPAVVTVPPMSRSTPVRVQIPAIGVDSGLMDLGLASDGAMQTPPTGFPAGWYTAGPMQTPPTGFPAGWYTAGPMQTPPTGFPAGWYTAGPTPGQLDPAVVVGHVDWARHPGVFYNLRELKTGDQVIVARTDARKVVFRVSRVEEFAKDAFPTHEVYGNVDHAALRLITCGGSFDQQAASYRDNIVAFADLVATTKA